jgi:hypothetical protein
VLRIYLTCTSEVQEISDFSHNLSLWTFPLGCRYSTAAKGEERHAE